MTQAQIAASPSGLLITAGRVHFTLSGQVAPDGTIALLYVWATITTHTRRLDLWYQPSADNDWRLLKSIVYDLGETVARLRPEFRRA